MIAGFFSLVNKPCECGGTLVWRRRGFIRPVWRLECLCGRCGPWRISPETEPADAIMLRDPVDVQGVMRPLMPPPLNDRPVPPEK